MSKWNELSMKEKSEIMKVAVHNGIYNLNDIKQRYNEFAEGGDTNPAMTGMMKSKLATAAQFGNPTARRMTNYDTRSYTWPGEYEYDLGIGEPRRGNVYVSSYGNLVTPQIQDTGNGLTFIDNVWSPENDQRSYMQSLKFNNDTDAQYFGDHYKEVAPMMNLYSKGGHKIHIKPENRGKFTRLKERTGHSASWFKAHGTPAQKKMAIFELNARHWKHDDGGYLFGNGGDKQSWKQQHQNRWYGFLKNKGVNDTDAQRLAGFFTAQDGLESAGGQSSAAREKNNFGGMQKNGKNITYDSIDAYMEDKWNMMNNRFKPALSAQSIDEYATILGNPETAGKGYLYYVTDKAKYDPTSPEWRAAQTQHMYNYINGMRAWAGMGKARFDTPKPIEEPQNPAIPLFMPSNPMNFFQLKQPEAQPVEETVNPLMDLIYRQYEPSEAELKKAEQQDNLRRFNLMMSLLSPQKESNSLFDTIGLLSDMSNSHSYGGHIYDGTTESTQQMNNIMSYNPERNYWTGPQTLLDPVTVTGNAPKKQKGLYPVRHKFKGFDNWVSPQGAGNMSLAARDAMKGVDAATGPLLHWMQPSQYVGAVRDAANGRNPLVSMLRGNSGVVSEEYAQEHPWVSTALNLGTDATVLGSIGKVYTSYNKRSPHVSHELTKANETPIIQSELDWSPEGWLGTRATGKYDAEDIAALQSHLPEYYEIERAAKANGTWLKMPDGSIWEGDPRSWVQLQSKAGQKLSQERLFTGMDMDKARNPNYTGEVWADKERKVSSFWAGEDSTYPGKVLEVAPAKGPRLVVDAKGHVWSDIPREQNGTVLPITEGWKGTTSDGVMEYAIERGYPTSQINNVIEGSGDLVTDVMIHPHTPRKSLLGNNGNFDFSNPNIYKGLIPLGLIGTTYSTFSK